MKKMNYIKSCNIAILSIFLVVFGCKDSNKMNDVDEFSFSESYSDNSDNFSSNIIVKTENPLERVLRGIDRTDAHLFLSSKNIRSIKKTVDTESQNYRRMMKIAESNKEMKDYMRLTNDFFSLGTDVLYSYITNELVSFRASFPEGTDENPNNIQKISRLKKIYDLMGTNLVSLIPFYESNLETNCNFVCAIYGLTSLSQAGVPSLMKALTNHSSALQEMGMTGVVMAGWDAVTYYDETINPDIAKKVLPLLLPYLHHPSEEVRMQVMTGLQVYCTAPEESIPALLECALTDSDDFVKVRAIRSVLGILKRFEVSDSKVVDTMTKIANDEQEHEDLRNAMKYYLMQMQNDMSGTNSSQKVQGE